MPTKCRGAHGRSFCLPKPAGNGEKMLSDHRCRSQRGAEATLHGARRSATGIGNFSAGLRRPSTSVNFGLVEGLGRGSYASPSHPKFGSKCRNFIAMWGARSNLAEVGASVKSLVGHPERAWTRRARTGSNNNISSSSTCTSSSRNRGNSRGNNNSSKTSRSSSSSTAILLRSPSESVGDFGGIRGRWRCSGPGTYASHASATGDCIRTAPSSRYHDRR
mmetsp:Transcript_22348/g.48898  ORF Transcript_22348/g.48898 Transcript_22348/m.48898 type:complete len:219 (+) Transcript_22348:402-1058(+)